MYSLSKSASIVLLAAALAGCSSNQSSTSPAEDTSSNQETQSQSDSNTSENEEAVKTTETTGYVSYISRNEIFIVPSLEQVQNLELQKREKKGQIIILTRDMDKKKIESLEVGQKVKVTHDADVMYSDPVQAYGVDIEVLK